MSMNLRKVRALRCTPVPQPPPESTLSWRRFLPQMLFIDDKPTNGSSLSVHFAFPRHVQAERWGTMIGARVYVEGRGAGTLEYFGKVSAASPAVS